MVGAMGSVCPRPFGWWMPPTLVTSAALSLVVGAYWVAPAGVKGITGKAGPGQAVLSVEHEKGTSNEQRGPGQKGCGLWDQIVRALDSRGEA